MLLESNEANAVRRLKKHSNLCLRSCLQRKTRERRSGFPAVRLTAACVACTFLKAMYLHAHSSKPSSITTPRATDGPEKDQVQQRKREYCREDEHMVQEGIGRLVRDD